ncbi:hypothetical protein D4740_06365 [Actinomyces sp. 2119]|uniref:hypothetical protein n=1 Tax=Actinomyces sp. 2119 TaxID=2321393 RepID=UPI000E6B745E|nr:hypothetical protein [Actinomyces sp. 2119]RJF42553.1 hypothetical protein D4740_06365 [Actinomyces sp. 2119]
MRTMIAPSSSSLCQTPLHRTHDRLGARLRTVSGWAMPWSYVGEQAEHRAARHSAGILDLSHTGEVRVEGPGAAAALDGVLADRVSTLAVGRSGCSAIAGPDGGVIDGVLDEVVVHHVGEEEFLLVTSAASRERVAAELVLRCAGTGARVTDLSLDTALIAVLGPRAPEVLCHVVGSGPGIPAALGPAPGQTEPGGDVPDVLCGTGIVARLRCCAIVRATAAGHSVLLARTRRHGQDGFELFCGWEDAEDLWHTITGAAAALPANHGDAADLAVLTPCGLGAHGLLRREAGVTGVTKGPGSS